MQRDGFDTLRCASADEKGGGIAVFRPLTKWPCWPVLNSKPEGQSSVGLENRYRCKPIESSNLSLSAILSCLRTSLTTVESQANSAAPNAGLGNRRKSTTPVATIQVHQSVPRWPCLEADFAHVWHQPSSSAPGDRQVWRQRSGILPSGLRARWQQPAEHDQSMVVGARSS
jgi:hypothetical protein